MGGATILSGVDEIVTPRLRMRPFEEADADALFAVFADPLVGRYIGGPATSRAESVAPVARNRAHHEQHGFSMWAVEERASGELLGEVGLQLLELKGPEVEIGWTLGSRWWGRGYATEGARAWLDRAFTTLALDEVLATVLPENDASHRVARRLGMRPIGRRHVHDAEHDVYRASR
jgi:RimJ/RimL family protein N-acetyltransferase